MLECGCAGLLDEFLLREDLVEVDLESGFDAWILRRAPQRGDGLEKTVVPAILGIDAENFQ